MAFNSSTSPLLTTTSVSGDPSIGLQSSENLIAQSQYGLEVRDGGAGGQFEVRSTGNLLSLAQLNTTGIIALAIPGDPNGLVTATVQGNNSILIEDGGAVGGIVQISVVPSTTLQFHQTQVNGVNIGTPYDTINFVSSDSISFVGTDGGDTAIITANATSGGAAPIDGPFLITAPDPSLVNATDLGSFESGIVYATTEEGIATVFTTLSPVMNGTFINDSTIAAQKIIGTAVTLTANQTITGAKTFTSNVIVPTLSVVSGSINMNNHTIINVTDPVNPQDAATKAYVDAQMGSADQWSTFPALQNVNMASHKLTNVTDPTAAQDAATKNYVDTAIGTGVATWSTYPATQDVDMDGNLINNVQDPSDAQDAMTLAYADAHYLSMNSVTVETTDATPTTILDYNVAVFSSVVIKGLVSSTDTGGTGEAYGAEFMVVVKNIGAPAVIIGTPWLTENATSTQTIQFSISSNDLVIKVVGLGGTTIDWRMSYTVITTP